MGDPEDIWDNPDAYVNASPGVDSCFLDEDNLARLEEAGMPATFRLVGFNATPAPESPTLPFGFGTPASR